MSNVSDASKKGVKVTLIRGRAIVPSVNKVARALAHNGYDVKLLVWDRQHNLDADSGDGYAFCRFRLKAPYDKYTALLYMPLWWMYQFFFLLRDEADIVHACDLDTLFPAVAIKLVKRVKLCYTIYDFYAHNLPDGRLLLVRNIIRRILAAGERFGIGFTDALFLVSESLYEHVRRARIKRVAYIYNSPPDCLDAKAEHESRAGARTTLFYAGTVTRSRGLEDMIQIVTEMDGVRLIIAGLWPDNPLSENQHQGAKNKIQYLGWLPYDQVLRHTLAADIVFAFYDPVVPQHRGQSPNKLFEAMMCAKPIIISDGSWGANVVRHENCGLVVPYGDLAAIREAVLKLRDDPDLRQKLGKNGRRAYEQKYSWRIMEQRILDIYRELGKVGARRKAERRKARQRAP